MLNTTDILRESSYLFEEFLLDGDIMIGDAQDDQTVLGFLVRVHPAEHIQLIDKLILDKDQSLHGMLQGQFMLSHLTEDGADVQVYVARVGHLETFINRLFTEVQIVVLDLKCLL